MEPTDLELVTRAGQGDSAAFCIVVDRHAAMLLRSALGRTAKREDAEDLVQETFEAAYTGASEFRGAASVRSWLIGILYRRAARHHRYSSLRKTEELDEMNPPEKGNGVMSEPQSNASLDAETMLASLSEDHRSVMVLREIEGFTYEEIADSLDVPRGTVESRLYRARQQIRQTFSDYFVPEPGREPATEV